MDLPIGQLFVFGFDGPSLPLQSHLLLQKHHAGGVILFQRNIETLEQVVLLNTEVGKVQTAQPPLIAVDQEGGRVARLRHICTELPPMRVFEKEDPHLVYQLGALAGRELAALGFHLNFAPVMDVDTNPKNPIIGDRSFSSDPALVGRLGAAWIKGMQGAGVAACAKHFPGHGDTYLDSHLELPVITHDWKRLEQVELPPFLASVQAKVASVMTGHVLVQALDSKHIATLSQAVLQQLLRREMGFQGVVFSDDLEMKAIADHYALEDQLFLGLQAGVDVFLICKNTDMVEQAIAIVHRLVRQGHIPVERIAQSLERIRSLKKNYVGYPALPNLEYAKQIVRSAPHLQLLSQIHQSKTTMAL